jgi:hypothetical protein
LTYPSLPHVTVIAPTEDQVRRRDWTEETVRWILSNPVYAGIGPVRDRYVSYQQWIDGAVKLMAEDGTVQFLVNMIHTLRQTFSTVAPNRPPADSIVAVQPTEAVYDPPSSGSATRHQSSPTQRGSTTPPASSTAKVPGTSSNAPCSHSGRRSAVSRSKHRQEGPGLPVRADSQTNFAAAGIGDSYPE